MYFAILLGTNILIGIGHLLAPRINIMMNVQSEKLRSSQQGSEIEDSHSYSLEGRKMCDC